MDKRIIDDIANRFVELLPPQFKSARERVHTKAREILRNKLTDLDLISREEFQATQDKLQAAQAQLKELEAQVAELEEKQQ